MGVLASKGLTPSGGKGGKTKDDGASKRQYTITGVRRRSYRRVRTECRVAVLRITKFPYGSVNYVVFVKVN